MKSRSCARAPAPELDRPLAAFDLDEGPDRRLVERDRDVFRREFLAELLIAEPHVQSERLEHAHQHVAVADDGLVFLARTSSVLAATGPLNVSRLLPDSLRTRSAQPARRSDSSSVSNSASSWSRRHRSGAAPAARIASRASAGACELGV